MGESKGRGEEGREKKGEGIGEEKRRKGEGGRKGLSKELQGKTMAHKACTRD